MDFAYDRQSASEVRTGDSAKLKQRLMRALVGVAMLYAVSFSIRLRSDMFFFG